jgi:flavin reductase (DIM6/NTAB) family NADH-FMN oxidoreductase RutF
MQGGAALKADGTVVAWPAWSGIGDVPAGLVGVTAISAKNDHARAVRSDGTLVAWGSDYYGESDVATGLTGLVAVAAAYQHSLALKTDGTVVAWRDNGLGQTRVPQGLTGVTALAGGYGYSLALGYAPIDTTPPVITVPDPVPTVVAQSAEGAHVEYSRTALDAGDRDVPVPCTPDSVTVFPVAVTTVCCAAADRAGNTATATFTVTVVRPPIVAVTPASADLGDVKQGETAVTVLSVSNTGQAALHVTGTVTKELPACAQVKAILAFYDASFADASLTTVGKLGALKKAARRGSLEAADDLIARGYTTLACLDLYAALLVTDGKPMPPDFVTGPSAPLLAAKIVALRTSLGCK